MCHLACCCRITPGARFTVKAQVQGHADLLLRYTLADDIINVGTTDVCAEPWTRAHGGFDPALALTHAMVEGQGLMS